MLPPSVFLQRRVATATVHTAALFQHIPCLNRRRVRVSCMYEEKTHYHFGADIRLLLRLSAVGGQAEDLRFPRFWPAYLRPEVIECATARNCLSGIPNATRADCSNQTIIGGGWRCPRSRPRRPARFGPPREAGHRVLSSTEVSREIS